MASIVTMAPAMSNIVKGLGIAVIALDCSSTLSGPNTRRLALAHARTLWMAAGPVARSHECRSVLPSMDTLAPPDAARKASVHALKHRVKASGSRRDTTRRNVSCPGMPCGKSKMSAHHWAWAVPDSSTSSQPSAPHHHCAHRNEENIPQRVTAVAGVGASRIGQRGTIVLKR